MSRLLTDAQMQEAANAPETASWARTVGGAGYRTPGDIRNTRDIPRLLQAVDRSVWHRTHRLSRVAGGRPGNAVALLLAHRDLANILAVVAAAVRQTSVAAAAGTVLAGGVLSPAQLDELLRARDAGEVADRLTTWGFHLHLPVRRAVRLARGAGLADMRITLAREYMRAVMVRARELGYPVVVRYLGDRIDIRNLMTALAWRTLPTDRDPLLMFIEGGSRLGRKRFLRMIEADEEDAPGILGRAGFLGRALAGAVMARELSGRLSAVEEYLDRSLEAAYTRPVGLDPLGLELTLAYLLKLNREGVLLKTSLVRLATGLTPAQLAEVAGDV